MQQASEGAAEQDARSEHSSPKQTGWQEADLPENFPREADSIDAAEPQTANEIDLPISVAVESGDPSYKSANATASQTASSVESPSSQAPSHPEQPEERLQTGNAEPLPASDTQGEVKSTEPSLHEKASAEESEQKEGADLQKLPEPPEATVQVSAWDH